jgi:hypothetical protein
MVNGATRSVLALIGAGTMLVALAALVFLPTGAGAQQGSAQLAAEPTLDHQPMGAERGGKMPKLTGPDAKRYVKQVLDRHPNRFGQWRYMNGGVRSCKRLSRVRMSCRVFWWAGDVHWKGRVTVYYWRHRSGNVYWDYRYKIKFTNEYCIYGQNKPKRKCTKVYKK